MAKLLFVVFLLSAAGDVSAQDRVDGVHRVDPSQMYHRVYARMPVTGAGTKADPIRPLLAPAPALTPAAATAVANNRPGMLSYTMILSDDGKWALVEFVAQNPNELASITASTAVSSAGSASSAGNVVIFERGKATVAQIEADFQQYKKGFTMANFANFMGRPQ